MAHYIFIVPLLLVLVVSFLSRGEYGDVRLPFTLKIIKDSWILCTDKF